jgi:hypothetical protein
MCDPVTVAMAGVQVAGSISQGNASRRAAEEQAGWDEYQAKVSRAEAEAQASRIRRAGRVARGETLSALVASGVKVGEGTALEAERQVMTDYETDAAMAILSGERAAVSSEVQASTRRKAGRDAQRAGYINAGTSLLSAGRATMRNRQPNAPVENRDIFTGYGGRY